MKHRILIADDEEPARFTAGHDAGAGRARAHPANAGIREEQQDARRRDSRHDPQDPSQQSPALAVRGG